MRVLTFVIFFFLAIQCSYSQNCIDTSFVKLYNSSNTILTNQQIITTKNDTTILAGRYENNTTNDSGLYITKLSPLGNIIWAKKIIFPNNNFLSINNIIELGNGDIIINTISAYAFKDILLIKLSNNGNTIWVKNFTYDDPLGNISDTRIYNFKNELYISYMSETPTLTKGSWNSTILKLDTGGNIIWNKYYVRKINRYSSSCIPVGLTESNNCLIAFGRMELSAGGDFASVDAVTESSYYTMKVNKQDGSLIKSVAYANPIELKPGGGFTGGGALSFFVNITATNNRIYLSALDYYKRGKYTMSFDSNLNVYSGSFYSSPNNVKYNFGRIDVDNQGNANIVYNNGLGSPDLNQYIIKLDSHNQVIRQKYLTPAINSMLYRSSGNPFTRKRNYLNYITNLITNNNNSYLQLYQLSNDEQNSDCYGKDTNLIKIEPYKITPYRNFFDTSFDLNAQINNINISCSDIVITETIQCQQISNCSSLKIIPAKDTICSKSQKFIFSAQKNATCYKHIFWQIDTSAVSEIIPINDTAVSIQFKKPWQGYLYASVNSCSLLKDSIKLTVIESPNSISLGNDTTLCMGQSFLLNAKKGFKSYRWQDGTIDSMFLIKTNNFNVNTYYVTATDYCGNQFSDTINVNFKTNPAINLGNDTSICINQSLLLDAGIGFNKYRWNTGELTQQLLVNKAGGYYVYAIDSINCFTVSSNIIISTKPAPSISLNKTGTLCLNQNNIIHAGTNYATYLWQDRSIDSNFIVTSPGLYKVTVSNTLNCFAADSVTITNIIIPPTHFLPIDTAICKEEPIIIHPTQSFSDYRWNNGSINNNISINQPGTYWLIAKDKNSCIATDTINVIQKDCENRFFIPTSFTPNNDGINDILKPTFTGRLISYHYILYNRWGQKIFESNNAINGWDGRYTGTLQEQGVYTWYCTYQFKDKPIETKKGTCMLLY